MSLDRDPVPLPQLFLSFQRPIYRKGKLALKSYFPARSNPKISLSALG